MRDLKLSINIPETLDLIQRSTACHLKHAQTLRQAFEDEEQFDKLFNIFRNCLSHAFSTDYKENVYLKRITNFVAVFATSYKRPVVEGDSFEFHPVLEKIFEFLLQLSESANNSHRYWACTLFNRIFQDMEQLTEEIYEKIKDSMLERIKDPKSAIRNQGIIGLYRLQDPCDPEDPIVDSFCTLLDSDYNAKVRHLCLEKLAINKRSLPCILTRLRDVDVNVRLAGLQKLKSIPKLLKVSQRRHILQCGFFDSTERIKNFTAAVLAPAWLASYENDFVKLMASIRLDANEEDIKKTTHLLELLLNALFESTPIEKVIQQLVVNEKKVIDYENLNWESMLFYRLVVDFLRKSDAFEIHLNKVLPELVQFCQYIKEYFTFIKDSDSFNELQHQFLLRQMFLITRGYDVCDTVCTETLKSLVHHTLQNEVVTADTAELIVQNLDKTVVNVTDRCIFICEIISNITYGEEFDNYEELAQKENNRKLAISELQFEINSMEDTINHLAFVENNLIEANRVQEQLLAKIELLKDLRTVQEPEEKERKTDEKTMLKCLTIAEALLRSDKITKFNGAIETLNSEIILPTITHQDDRVKAKALTCYALCCIIDHCTARYGIHVFSGFLFIKKILNIEMLVTSIQATADILSMYGLALVGNSDEEEEASDSLREEDKKIFVGGTSLTDVLQALADHLNHKDPQVEESATTAICMFLLNNRVTSSSLLSRIFLKWCNPATDNERVKQIIGFTLKGLITTTHTYFADAVIVTIQVIVYAPKTSPLCDVNIENIIKFMVTWCQMSLQNDKIQNDLASKICNQILKSPKKKVNFYLSKVLVLLKIKGESQDELLTLCNDLKQEIKNSPTLKNINKFIANINKNKGNMVPITEETLD